MEIRSFTISFAKVKAKKREDYEKILTQEAEELQKLIDVQPTVDNIYLLTEWEGRGHGVRTKRHDHVPNIFPSSPT